MAKEIVEVKLARFEGKLDALHQDVKELKGIIPYIQSHRTEIALLKRDRRWMKVMMSTVAGFMGALVHRMFGGHQ